MEHILTTLIGVGIGSLIGITVCHVDKMKAYNEGLEYGVGLGRAFADKERGK